MSDHTDIPLVYGTISTVIALLATAAVYQVKPDVDIQWALIAVGIASFLSGTISAKYAKQ